jgi:uncharacterized small protein (DUF1192 family)
MNHEPIFVTADEQPYSALLRLAAENHELKAEIERLKAELAAANAIREANYEPPVKSFGDALDQIARLKAELAEAREACRKAVDCAETIAMDAKCGWQEAWVAEYPDCADAYERTIRETADDAKTDIGGGHKVARRIVYRFADTPPQTPEREPIPKGVCFANDLFWTSPTDWPKPYAAFANKWYPRRYAFPQPRRDHSSECPDEISNEGTEPQ